MSKLDRVQSALCSLRRNAEVPFYEEEAEVALGDLSEYEQDVNELIALSEHALIALRAQGYNIAADQLAKVIAKVKGEKK